MYYGRKKGIIIAIVVVILVLVLALGGVLLYMKTDLFKSNKTLFWKYVGSSNESLKVEENTQIKNIEKMKEQKPFKSESEITVGTDDEDTNKILEKFAVTVNEQTDRASEYSHIETKLNYDDKNLFGLNYVQDNNVYALKSDEIVTAYVGVRNENLKVFFQKLGITSDDIELPNELEVFNLADILTISDTEKAHIKETYTTVIETAIPDTAYSKQTEAIIVKDGVDYKTTAYRLNLTASEMSDLVVKMLNTLKTDSITLNLISTKLKDLGLTDYSSIDTINQAIDEMINSLDESKFVDTSFVVYAYKGEAISMEILAKNQMKITIYTKANGVKTVIEDYTGESDISQLTLDVTYIATATNTNLIVKIDTDIDASVELNLTISGNADLGNVDTTASAVLNVENTSYELNYQKALEFVDELSENDKQNLDSTNSVVLNDYSQEQLVALMQALVNQIQSVYEQKVQTITSLVYTQPETINENNIIPQVNQ